MIYLKLAERIIAGSGLERIEAHQILSSPDSDLDQLLEAASLIRKYYHGNRIKLHLLLNAKSGICPEDCHFCSQSSISKSSIAKYRLLSSEEIVENAKKAKQNHAWKFCLVLASRGPDEHEMNTVCNAVREIKKSVKVNVCTSMGILSLEQAKRLKDAGVDRFNHNLETSPSHFSKICSSHTYQDRVNTIKFCKEAKLGTCCGGIAGMGETDDDLIDLAFECRRLDVDSIPVNFLNPINGTPLGAKRELTPQRCLRILSLFRFANPSKDIRVAGGREYNLKDLQPLALKIVNSIFTEGYLTTPGSRFNEDFEMITKAGYEIVEP